MALPQVVSAAPLLPPRISLLSAATIIDTDSERWGNSIAWEPEGCGDNTGVFDPQCPTGEVTKDVDASCLEACSGAFVAWAAKTRSTFDLRDKQTGEDLKAQIERKLLACESKIIEGEIYTNSLQLCTQAIAATGESFTDLTPGSGAVRPEVAIAVLEGALAETNCGQRSMIHVTPFILSRIIALGGFGLLTLVDNVWLTPTGNAVVPGRGYDGRFPDGSAATASAEYIYATSWVAIRRGAVQIYPRDLKQAVARSTNDVLFYAERLAVGQWDPCTHLAIEVDRTACPSCD